MVVAIGPGFSRSRFVLWVPGERKPEGMSAGRRNGGMTAAIESVSVACAPISGSNVKKKTKTWSKNPLCKSTVKVERMVSGAYDERFLAI